MREVVKNVTISHEKRESREVFSAALNMLMSAHRTPKYLILKVGAGKRITLCDVI